MGRTGPLTGVDLSHTDVGTEHHPFGIILRHVLKKGRKAASSILEMPLCPTEQAVDRLFYTLLTEGLPCFVSKYARIAHM